MKFLSILAATIAAAVVAGCTSTDDPQPQPVEFVVRAPYAWQQSTPLAQGLDSALVNSAVGTFKTNTNCFGLVVIRNGFLVTEYYRTNLTQYSDYDIRSATKSFVSVLVGIAIKNGLIADVDEPVLKFFPAFDTSGIDARKRNLTIEHLLTMRSGLDIGEGGTNSNLYTTTSNWVNVTLSLPMVSSPGTQFRYSSMNTHLLSAILTRATGMSTYQFAESNLLAPLSISLRYWDRDPQGIFFGGTGANFCTRDIARLGYLMLQQGSVDGQQILSSAWVQQSRQPHNFVNSTWSSFDAVNYGYQWWTNDGPTDSLFFAAGFGGQFIFVAPAQNMVIAATAEANVSADVADYQEQFIIEIVATKLLKAVK
jgi:CubicO group peptidase (beta-lactamase class C family)